jgi:hypothetical protein
MATVLPAPERQAPDVTAALDAARETLTRLGATPFRTRLEMVAPSTVSSPTPPPDHVAGDRQVVPNAG